MAKNWIVGIGLIALVLGGLFLAGYITLPGEGKGDMSVVLLDENGDPLPKILAWYIGDDEVSGFQVSLSWIITGGDIDYDTLIVTGMIKVFVTDITLGIPEEKIDEKLFTEYTKDGLKSYQWVFDDIVATGNMVERDYKFRIWGQLEAEAADIQGQPVYAETWEDTVTFNLHWDPDLQTMTIVGDLYIG